MFDKEAVPALTMDEQIIRFLVYNDHIKRHLDREGEYVHWRGLKPNRGGVSVTRRLCCTNAELKQLGDAVARKARKDPSAVVIAYGSATVNECTSKQHSIFVREDALDDNPNHANIIQTDPGESEEVQITIDHFLSSKLVVMRVLDEPGMEPSLLNV